MSPYAALCDDFGAFVYINTKTELPSKRETILNFFDNLQKAFPTMTEFEVRPNGEYALEEDREKGPYRWVSIDPRRFGSGFVNPPSLEDADRYHDRILEVSPYHLDLSPLDCESMDVLFTFDFVYQGNHNDVVAEALGLNTTLESMLQLPGTRILNYEPQLMLALDESCRLQSRLHIETRTNAYQIRTGQFPESPITVYYTVRQYWSKLGIKKFGESFQHQRKVCQDMVDQHLVGAVLKPLSETIANKQ